MRTVAHWTVRNAETHVILAEERIEYDFGQGIGSMRSSFTLGPDLPYLDEPILEIAVRVVRELGPITEPVLSASTTCDVGDFLLDRSHPYVRWRHEVPVPSVRVEEDGTRTIQGYPVKRRISKIHRTVLPGRCLMVRNRSLASVTFPAPVPPVSGIEYLDELPFDPADLSVHRALVCDYCFVGGPGRTVSLIG